MLEDFENKLKKANVFKVSMLTTNGGMVAILLYLLQSSIQYGAELNQIRQKIEKQSSQCYAKQEQLADRTNDFISRAQASIDGFSIKLEVIDGRIDNNSRRIEELAREIRTADLSVDAMKTWARTYIDREVSKFLSDKIKKIELK